MDLKLLNSLLDNSRITALKFRDHTKASEKYVDVKIIGDDGSIWNVSIPYYYRRTAVFLENEHEIAEYLSKIIDYFTESKIDLWCTEQKYLWEKEFSSKNVTKPFFDKLLNLEWNSVKHDFPPNPNWARRIQDIKELGYTLSTDTKRLVKGKNENDTHLLLLPFPRGALSGYEMFSSEFKKKILKLLNSSNCYELSSANKSGLIPDHKFPEIRWDHDTKQEEHQNISDDEIKNKYQLIDNQRNQQKREVCRKCTQTDKRGILFGINFFYEGDEIWSKNIPKIGKEAEKGCVGCGWYDIDKWRKELNIFIRSFSKPDKL